MSVNFSVCSLTQSPVKHRRKRSVTPVIHPAAKPRLQRFNTSRGLSHGQHAHAGNQQAPAPLLVGPAR